MWPSDGWAVSSRIACCIRSSSGWRPAALATCVKQARLRCLREPSCGDSDSPTVGSKISQSFLRGNMYLWPSPDWTGAGRACTGMAFHRCWGWTRFKMSWTKYFDDPNLWILKCFVSVDESENAFLHARHRYGRSPLLSIKIKYEMD